jgi:hypothetical protein
MRRVILESPYASKNPDPVLARAERETNVAYARVCVADCLRRGEAPIASHLLFPGILDDAKPEERKLGIAAGLAWVWVAQAMVVYTDLGISPGMQVAIAFAEEAGIPIERRTLNMREAAE